MKYTFSRGGGKKTDSVGLPTTSIRKYPKLVRPEPISALYADGLVHHVGVFEELEGEMTTWTTDRTQSLNRMDALAWALVELMLEATGEGGNKHSLNSL